MTSLFLGMHNSVWSSWQEISVSGILVDLLNFCA